MTSSQKEPSAVRKEPSAANKEPSAANKEPYEKLYQNIAYRFATTRLVRLALTHRSARKNNNERLEFLGDSILGFIIAEELYRQFPAANEGELSRLRAGLVKGETLAELAIEFDVGRFLQLGSGESKSGGSQRQSILADSVEALIGAIYLDAGLEVCRQKILFWYQSRLDDLPICGNPKDSKTRLQEYLQAKREKLPEYTIAKTTGEAHEQTFFIECDVSLLKRKTQGQGVNRRAAEQQAAHQALLALGLEAGVEK